MPANISLILSTILWGFWAFAHKQAADRAPPFTVQMLFNLPYVLSLPAWYWLAGRGGGEASPSAGAVLWCVGASLSSMGALVLFMVALRGSNPSWVVVASSAYPIVTIFLLIAAGQERVSASLLVGATLVVVGLVAMQRGV